MRNQYIPKRDKGDVCVKAGSEGELLLQLVFPFLTDVQLEFVMDQLEAYRAEHAE